MITFISSLIVFLLVVIIHEFGHFIVAKISGIRVNEFSIGMGPKIAQKKKGETIYSLRVLPIGGYVQLEGEDLNSEDPRSFQNANIKKRMATILAGAFMNFILAFLAFSLIVLITGYGSNVIENISDGSPAKLAKLNKGDEIISLNNKKVNDLLDINKIINSSDGAQIEFKILRKGIIITKNIKPVYSDVYRTYLIGFTAKTKHSVLKSFKVGFDRLIFTSKTIFETLNMIFTGNFKMEYLSGPVGVVKIIGSESSKGLIYFLQILGLISVNLGIFNLLPIPALDGGKFLFLIIEFFRGKPIDPKLEQKLTLIGIIILFSLMIYVTIFNDLGRLFK